MASFKDRFHNHKKTSNKPLENSGRRPAHSEENLNHTRPMTAVKHTSGGRRPSNRGFFSSFWHYVTNSLRGNWKASLDKDSIFKERTKPPHMALAIITTTMNFMLVAVLISVSYTHLDVYKRQVPARSIVNYAIPHNG